jgi:large subunit ribosomal protein L29
MKQAEIVKLSTEDLISKVASASEQLSSMIFNHKMTPVENPLRIRLLRREIARMRTELAKR